MEKIFTFIRPRAFPVTIFCWLFPNGIDLFEIVLEVEWYISHIPVSKSLCYITVSKF